jgi:hypothetical protein
MSPDDCMIVEPVGREVRVMKQDCVGLERAAVWAHEHLESRIADAYAGRPNRFLESLGLKI